MAADHEKGVQLRAVEFRVLGPLTVVVDGRARKLGGPRQRTVLAVLLSQVNRTVSQDQLIDLVWQGNPPEAAKATLQSYIYGLRREIDADVIVRHGDGYRVEADADRFDALRFEGLVTGARTVLGDDPASALDELTLALSLWYGSPYGGLDGNASLVPEVARLDALRLNAVERRIDARLALGDQAGALDELETLVREHPLRERFRAQQMLALYRSGRQSEALRAYQELRRHLGEELGIEPGTELRALEQQILDQDSALIGPTPVERDDIAARVPHVVRGYELRDAIGAGAVGIVQRAYQPTVGREVAIKVIRPEHANEPSFVRRFEREARIVAQLEHPHVVPLFDFWRDPGGAFLVMPHLRGGNLSTALSKGGWHVEPAVQLVQQIGSALAYAHRHGVVHRDLKAANVLLDEEGNAYLTDFAIATTGSNDSVGSGGIVPPERLLGAEHTALSDQFCLAVLAYQVLTGVLPSITAPLPPITEARPGLGVDLSDVLVRASSEEPAERYPSVDAFLRSLRRSVGLDVIAISDPTSRQTDRTVRNPYKGLRSFHESDSADFFGRDGAVAELQCALAAHHLVTVVGPSGCGKSSLVRAGLVPSLRAGAIRGSRGWVCAGMYPGTHPVEELAHALLGVAVDRPPDLVSELHEPGGLLRVAKRILPGDDSKLVLVVDQFEELFSLTGSESDRATMIGHITNVAALAESPVKLVLTIRADFFDRPLEHPELGAAIAPGIVALGPPTRDGLTQAIVGPARSVGLDIEPGLVGRIMADVDTQPGALPLLQFALTELFDARSSDALTVADYDRTGGLAAALGRRAEELYLHLGDETRDVAAHVFLRLVTVEEGSPDARRRVRLSELQHLDIDQSAVAEVLHRFGAYRLLAFDRDPVTRGPTVEVAHEALLSEWERLAAWIEHRRESLAHTRRLRLATHEWEQSGRDESFLLRGGRLEQAKALVGAGDVAVTSVERALLDASTDHENEVAADHRRRRRGRLALLAAATLIVAALAGVAMLQREAALQQSREQIVRRLIADAAELVESDPDLALLLAIEAIDRGRGANDELRLAARTVVTAATAAQRVVLRPQARAWAVDANADGTLIAAAYGTDVHLLAARSGEPTVVLEGERPVTDVEFDPRSDRVAVSYRPALLGGPFEVVIWDARRGSELTVLIGEQGGSGGALSWSPDGGALAVLPWTLDARASIFDVSTGAETDAVRVGTARHVSFVDTQTVVLADPNVEEIAIWDLAASQVRSMETPGIEPGSIDVDAQTGRVAVVGTDPLRLQMWDTASGAMSWSVYLPQPITGKAPIVAVDEHARHVAVSLPGRVEFYDADTGASILGIPHGGPLVDLAFGGRDHRLVAAGGGDVTVWDTSPGGPEAIAAGTDVPCGINLSPDDQRVVLTGVDGRMTLVDVATGKTVLSIPDQQINHEHQVTVSRDWRYMAWIDEHGETWVRDGATGRRLVQLPGCLTPKAFSGDGSMLLVDRGCPDDEMPSAGGGPVVMETLTGRELVTLDGDEIWGRSAAFTHVPGHEGEFLVVSIDGTITIFEIPSGRPVASLATPTGGWLNIGLDRDGRLLAASTIAPTVEVFDLSALLDGADAGDARVTTLDVAVEASSLALDGRGRLAITALNSLLVFDIDTGRLIAQPAVTIDTPPFATFTADGDALFYADRGPVLRRLELDTAALVDRAREKVTRPLTIEECRRYLGGACE